jgi:hypothetical protein
MLSISPYKLSRSQLINLTPLECSNDRLLLLDVSFNFSSSRFTEFKCGFRLPVLAFCRPMPGLQNGWCNWSGDNLQAQPSSGGAGYIITEVLAFQYELQYELARLWIADSTRPASSTHSGFLSVFWVDYYPHKDNNGWSSLSEVATLQLELKKYLDHHKYDYIDWRAADVTKGGCGPYCTCTRGHQEKREHACAYFHSVRCTTFSLPAPAYWGPLQVRQDT